MKVFYIVVLCAGATLTATPGASLAMPSAPMQAQADPADSLYRRARRALDDKSYDAAARLFDSIVSRYPRSVYTPDALYWKGFALYRNGNLDAAVTALETQAERYPNAPTRADAAPLLIVLKGELAKRGDQAARREVDSAAASGEACEDMEVRIAALDALQQMDSERVLPLLRRILMRRDDCSRPLRKNALFILAQKGGPGPEREKLLLDIATTDASTAVRQDAVFYLGQAKSEAAVDALEQILINGDQHPVRSNALFALAQMGTDRTRKIIQDFALRDGASIPLRKDAVFHLAQHSSAETNKWLASVVANARAPIEVRKDAVFHLAQQNTAASDDLAASYDGSLPLELKKDLLFHIAQRRDDRSLTKLIAIAKTDPNKQMRKDALFYLGQSTDPRALKAIEEIAIP
jgi:HEAT repeat protein